MEMDSMERLADYYLRAVYSGTVRDMERANQSAGIYSICFKYDGVLVKQCKKDQTGESGMRFAMLADL